MIKIIKPGQLVTVNNTKYRCEKAQTSLPWLICCQCDLKLKCEDLHFTCGKNSNFKRLWPIQ